MRILVPLDGSDRARAALIAARAIIAGAQGEIILFHASWPGIPVDPADKPIEAELEALQAAGLRASLEHRPTPRDEETGLVIASGAQELGADLIVMTTHGRGGLGRWLFGSVTEQVIESAQTQVMITPSGLSPDWPDDHHTAILVALDGSDDAELALTPAAELAGALKSKIVLIRVLANDGDATDDHAEQYLAAVGKTLGNTGVAATHLVRHGDPARTIADVANELNARAIALGAYREGSTRRARLGEVTMGIIRRSDVPILVA